MSRPVETEVSGMTGEAALPRRNGELVFEVPWQGRAFGLGVALCRGGHYPWSEFQASLIEAIDVGTAHEREHAYYEHWLAALERLLVAKGLASPEEIEQRTQEFLSGDREEVF